MNKSPMRLARERAGLTLAQVETATGIPFSTVQAFEAGRGAGYDIERKKKIADFLKAPFFKLWPEEREKIKEMQRVFGDIMKTHAKIRTAEVALAGKQREWVRLRDARKAHIEDGPK